VIGQAYWLSSLLRWSIALTNENCEGRDPRSASQGRAMLLLPWFCWARSLFWRTYSKMASRNRTTTRDETRNTHNSPSIG
jgi:hypothetical protein